jgi:hypothetical protein
VMCGEKRTRCLVTGEVRAPLEPLRSMGLGQDLLGESIQDIRRALEMSVFPMFCCFLETVMMMWSGELIQPNKLVIVGVNEDQLRMTMQRASCLLQFEVPQGVVNTSRSN